VNDVAQARVLLAVDGNSLVHRSYHAQAASGLRTVDGRPIWALRGLVGQLVAAVERIGPDAVVVGFDDPHSSVRRERWPQYKATRTDKLPTLVDQLELAVTVLRQLGVAVVIPTGLEADDVLASCAQYARTVDAATVIMTSDRDSFALIDDHTSVLRIINGGVEASPLLTPARLVTLLGVRPDQYQDFAALRGDPSDNLPGVRGIGPKTAAKLLMVLGSARAAFEDLDQAGGQVVAAIGAAAATKLAHPEARAAWELNCQVMGLHAGVALNLDLDAGAGVLPLAPSAVRAACELLQLPATLTTALRVLGHEETPGVTPRVAWSRTPDGARDAVAANYPGASAAGGSADPARPWSRPHAPRLARRPSPPEIEQLTLFDPRPART
jgi:5'-3' exonuclease